MSLFYNPYIKGHSSFRIQNNIYTIYIKQRKKYLKMSNNNQDTVTMRKEQLKQAVQTYFHALSSHDFSAIPYDEHIILRAPLVPGGVNNPLSGKELVKAQWWEPLEAALEGVRINILDHYINETLTGIITEAEITLANPAVTLRVADRFTIDSNGKIQEQENHFDASCLRIQANNKNISFINMRH